MRGGEKEEKEKLNLGGGYSRRQPGVEEGNLEEEGGVAARELDLLVAGKSTPEFKLFGFLVDIYFLAFLSIYIDNNAS